MCGKPKSKKKTKDELTKDDTRLVCPVCFKNFVSGVGLKYHIGKFDEYNYIFVIISIIHHQFCYIIYFNR